MQGRCKKEAGNRRKLTELTELTELNLDLDKLGALPGAAGEQLRGEAAAAADGLGARGPSQPEKARFREGGRWNLRCRVGTLGFA